MEIQQAFCQIRHTTLSLKVQSLFTQVKVAPSSNLNLLLKLLAQFLLLYFLVTSYLCKIFFLSEYTYLSQIIQQLRNKNN